eukprot:jgi/Botrbrau1/15805/Bobra.4_1s0155.1
MTESASTEELLSIPKHLISRRRGTIQFIINVQSFLDCSGLSANCNCVNSTRPPTLYQLIVDVDFPQGTGPFPIVWLWHGFGGPLLLNSRGYDEYVYAVNAAGYAVIQYDVIQAFIPILVQDAVELQFPIQVLNWLKFVSQNPASKFYNKFDFSRIATTGHSRGGKLSAYVYGKSLLPNIFTYIGIDPVDCACFAPCTSNCYPPAADTLSGKIIATIGATIKGCCNPTPPPPSCSFLGIPCYGVDYQGFLNAAAPGSKLYVSYAGHAQYAQLCAGFGVCNFAGDISCGANYSVSARTVQQQSAQEVVAWINSRLPPAAGNKQAAQAHQEAAAGITTIAPEDLATSAALRVPIDLVEGVHFSYSSTFPQVLVQEAYSNLQTVYPDLSLIAKKAGRVGVPEEFELRPVSSAPGAMAPEPEAVWPWGG